MPDPLTPEALDPTLFDLNSQGFVDSSNHPEIPDSCVKIAATEVEVGDLVFFTDEPPYPYLTDAAPFVVSAVSSYWRNPLSQTGTNMVETGKLHLHAGDTSFVPGGSWLGEGWPSRPDRVWLVRKGNAHV